MNFEYRIPIAPHVGLSIFGDAGATGAALKNQLELNSQDYTTLVQQFPNTAINRTLQFQPGTNFKPRTSAGLELVVQLPIVQAPFRIYWAYNFNRMSQVITAPVTQFPGPVSSLTTPCTQTTNDPNQCPWNIYKAQVGDAVADGCLEFPGGAADFEPVQQPAADEFLRSDPHVPVHGEPDVLIADFTGRNLVCGTAGSRVMTSARSKSLCCVGECREILGGLG